MASRKPKEPKDPNAPPKTPRTKSDFATRVAKWKAEKLVVERNKMRANLAIIEAQCASVLAALSDAGGATS